MKSLQLNLDDVVNINGAVLYNPDEFKPVTAVNIDSRKILKDSLFVALKGKNFDGHNFAGDAIKNGASALLINENKFRLFKDLNLPVIIVKDTIKALGELANSWRKKLNAKVIGITGSSGKTSTKDLLSSILNEKYKVQKTILNNNNHIGVPLTIFSTNLQHEILVAELGTNHFGEIPYTAKVLQPDISLITNIGYSHLEFLKSRKGVLKEKTALFDETLSGGGKVFLNYDDPLLRNYRAENNLKTTYGFESEAEVSGKIINYDELGRPVIEISANKEKMVFKFPVYGEMSAKNFLAAVAVALSLGISKNNIAAALDKLETPPHRMNSFIVDNFLLIDDSYNANPDSVKAAIEILGKISKYKRKILVMGDMLELGQRSVLYHSSLAKYINENKISEVYTIGKLTKYLNDSLSGNTILKKHFRDKEKLKDFLLQLDLNNSVILSKEAGE